MSTSSNYLRNGGMILQTDSPPGVRHMQIDELLSATMAAQNIPSDNQLSIRLKTSSGQIGMWRRGIYFPKDHTVIDLCELAGVPIEAGLMWLNAWRADEKAKPIYERLARDLEKRASKSRRAA